MPRYFSVVWCKHTAKKHKEWKEDAVMIVKSRSVILKVFQRGELFIQIQIGHSVIILSRLQRVCRVKKSVKDLATSWPSCKSWRLAVV